MGVSNFTGPRESKLTIPRARKMAKHSKIPRIVYIYYVLSDRITPRLNDSRPKPRPCYFTSEASEV